ncbi:MAG: ArsR/SmtB family transcription factor [Alphaproteobacteria bacterium]
MEKQTVIEGLAALAHETRLEAFRLLVKAGPNGLPAGDLATSLGIPPQTLSFHLKELSRAGLVTGDRQGRSIIYRPDFGHMTGLLDFLMEDCCGGACGAPSSTPAKDPA